MSLGKTYTITGTSFAGTLVFNYDLNGILTGFDLDGELTPEQISWLYSGRFPFTEPGMKMFVSITNFTVHGGEIDLSFENFWNMYGYKIGKKVMAENVWKRMSRADKIKALTAIKPYNSHLARNVRKDKAHASTYLNQRMYENDFNKF